MSPPRFESRGLSGGEERAVAPALHFDLSLFRRHLGGFSTADRNARSRPLLRDDRTARHVDAHGCVLAVRGHVAVDGVEERACRRTHNHLRRSADRRSLAAPLDRKGASFRQPDARAGRHLRFARRKRRPGLAAPLHLDAGPLDGRRDREAERAGIGDAFDGRRGGRWIFGWLAGVLEDRAADVERDFSPRPRRMPSPPSPSKMV